MGREVVGEFAIGDLVALTNAVGQHWGVFGIIYGFDPCEEQITKVRLRC